MPKLKQREDGKITLRLTRTEAAELLAVIDADESTYCNFMSARLDNDSVYTVIELLRDALEA